MNMNKLNKSFQDRLLGVRSGSEGETIIETRPSTQPAASVSTATQPLTTKAGKPRQRMKWNDEMNMNFRPELHRLYVEIYPELSHLTEQRLSDQVRVILKTIGYHQKSLIILKMQKPKPQMNKPHQINLNHKYN